MTTTTRPLDTTALVILPLFGLPLMLLAAVRAVFTSSRDEAPSQASARLREAIAAGECDPHSATEVSAVLCGLPVLRPVRTAGYGDESAAVLVADLAPVLALTYTPAPAATAEAKPARKPRAARKATPAPKAKVMAAAGRVKADPFAAAMRRVSRGESVRAAAKAEGVSESTLRGRLKKAQL